MTYKDLLREVADGQYGLVTVDDARAVGVPGVELRKLAHRGALRNVRRGLYRFTDARLTNLDVFAEAVARVGQGAYLTHDAVLALHGLAHVEPKRIKVATSARVRQRDLAFVDIVRRTNMPDEDITNYFGITSTTVACALVDCQGMVMRERLRDALRVAVCKDLVTSAEERRIGRELGRSR